MPNISQEIAKHNSKVMNKIHEEKRLEERAADPDIEEEEICHCNCNARTLNRGDCPLQGFCNQDPDGNFVENIVYSATVTAVDPATGEDVPDTTANYFGTAGRRVTVGNVRRSGFKRRFYEHNSNFNNRRQKGTTLSKYVWELKDQDLQYKVNWKVVTKAKPFDSTSRACHLCLNEIFYINHHNDETSLNKRTEFYSFCHHKYNKLFNIPMT